MLFHLYLPVYMQLVNILLVKVRMPPDDEYRSWNEGGCEMSRVDDSDIVRYFASRVMRLICTEVHFFSALCRY